MEQVQFILQHHGTVTINHEYTVKLESGQALQIDWFPDNDLIVSTAHHHAYYNVHNTTQIAPHTYLIQIVSTTDLHGLPIKFERGPYLVAGNVVIDQAQRTYLTADKLDLMPDEIVAAHGNRVTRILFSGDKIATEHYSKNLKE
ncbi:MAG: hypothetical protein NC133_00630 [Prevotella sp.]|nr:hypothetical protein [Prevotella sp.]